MPTGIYPRKPGQKRSPHTEEHKKKISEALKKVVPKGIHYSPATEYKKGHYHPPEVMEKLRQSHLGKHLSNEAKSKLSLFWKGKKKPPFSKEHRKNMSLAQQGKHHSYETCLKRSLIQRGAKHYNWQGGKTRRSFLTREWRKRVFERDNFTCQDCLKRGGKLQAHHIRPFALYPELRFEVSNGITLCETCHNKKRKELYKKYKIHKRRNQLTLDFIPAELGI
jgi:5-methylcytosine-specific restriction endonuclease McrA